MLEKELQLIQKAKELANIGDKKMAQKEAIQLLLTNPELLDPVCYVLVAAETGIMKVFTHQDYCLIMRKKVIETNNKALFKLVQSYEGSID